MNADDIKNRCKTLVPGVEVTDSGTDRRQWVEVTSAGQSVRFVLVHGLGEASWTATIKACDDPEEILPIDEIEDVARVLWVAFGSLVYPRVLWEVLEADAKPLGANPKIWDEAGYCFLHDRGFLEEGHAFNSRQAARFSLHMAITAREVALPADLVLEAIAMATPAHAMHRSWMRSTIRPDDRARISP